MSVSKARLTVYFEPPFWSALYRREDEEGCRVCKVTFGGEPRDQEVLDYFQSHWRELAFSPPVAGERAPDRAVSPKRARREAGRQTHSAGIGTKAQQALKLQREQGRQESKEKSRLEKAEEAERAYRLKRQKRRQKHRGR